VLREVVRTHPAQGFELELLGRLLASVQAEDVTVFPKYRVAVLASLYVRSRSQTRPESHFLAKGSLRRSMRLHSARTGRKYSLPAVGCTHFIRMHWSLRSRQRTPMASHARRWRTRPWRARLGTGNRAVGCAMGRARGARGQARPPAPLRSPRAGIPGHRRTLDRVDRLQLRRIAQ